MVAPQEIAGGRAHPAVEGAAAAGVRQEIEDARSQLAVDQRRERAPAVAEVLLELLAHPAEHRPDDRPRLDALEERPTEALGLRLRVGVAGGEPLGEPAQRGQHRPAKRVLRIARGAPQLGGRVVAGRFHDRALHDFPAEHERQEALPGRVQRARGALEPPVELRGGARPGGQVAEGQCKALERGPGALARHRAREPGTGGRVDR